MSEELKPMLEPVYGCVICYEEYSWSASDLFWNDELKAWMCDNCFSHETDCERGISLHEEMESRDQSLRKQNERLVKALESLLESIAKYSQITGCDMGGNDGCRIHIPQGKKGLDYHDALRSAHRLLKGADNE